MPPLPIVDTIFAGRDPSSPSSASGHVVALHDGTYIGYTMLPADDDYVSFVRLFDLATSEPASGVLSCVLCTRNDSGSGSACCIW